jgi:hypothetical protein
MTRPIFRWFVWSPAGGSNRAGRGTCIGTRDESSIGVASSQGQGDDPRGTMSPLLCQAIEAMQ